MREDAPQSLRLIGYWASDGDRTWPDPSTLIDLAWDEEEREDVYIHLRYGLVARAYMGKSSCRLCGEPVGNLEFTDGVYVWPEGLPHYVREHHVRLPAEFVEHVAAMADRFFEVPREESWWRSQAAR